MIHFVLAFFNKIVHRPDSESQNAFLTKFITPYTPVRRRPRKENVDRCPRVNSQYTIWKKDGSLVPVCAVAFRNICGIGKYLTSNYYISLFQFQQ